MIFERSYYRFNSDSTGHGKCSCWSQNKFFVVLVCISVSLNVCLYQFHNMLPSNNMTPLFTEFTNGLSSKKASTAPILPPTTTKNTTLLSLSSLTSEHFSSDLVTTTLATTMDISMNATDDDCNVKNSISSGITYHFEATTNFRLSKTLPQWMKGTYLVVQ
jgi:hypothetical protein